MTAGLSLLALGHHHPVILFCKEGIVSLQDMSIPSLLPSSCCTWANPPWESVFQPYFLLALEWDTPIPSGTTYPTVCTQPRRLSRLPWELTAALLFSSLRQSVMHESRVLCQGGVPVRIPDLSLPWHGGGVRIPLRTARFEGMCHTSHMVGPEVELGLG